MLSHSSDETTDLRWAESAAYNIREALEAVLRDATQPKEGGFPAVVTAFKKYEFACEDPANGEAEARSDFITAIRELVDNSDHHSFTTRRLLNWFEQQTGVTPIAGEADPSRQFSNLRDRANDVLHGDGSHDDVEALFIETVWWFTRLFTPPSDLMSGIVQLAEAPFSSTALEEFRELALTEHHIRLFLEHLTDPEWLQPLRQEGFIALSKTTESSWPVIALTGENHKIPGQCVADTLMNLLGDLQPLPKNDQLRCAFDLARAAHWLGPCGLPVLMQLLSQYPANNWIQTLAIMASESLDPTDDLHRGIADCVISNENRRDCRHTVTLLKRLFDGLNTKNVTERIQLLVYKVRHLAADDETRLIVIDSARLSAPLAADNFVDPVIIVSQTFAEAIPVAIRLGYPALDLLDDVRSIPGVLGERLACQVLTHATDVDRPTKLAHLQGRFASETATGDDQDLITALSPFTDDEIRQLQEAFGPPSKLDGSGSHDFAGTNWPRGWRWSLILPKSVLTEWDGAIAAVSAIHNSPNPEILRKRNPRLITGVSGSPIEREALQGLDVLDAAAAIASWRPTSNDYRFVSSRELARVLKDLVGEQPERWAQDPVTIVQVLREPIYIDHYFQGLESSAPEITAYVDVIFDALAIVRTEQNEPTVLGSPTFDYEPDWTQVDVVSIKLIRALANADADLTLNLNLCWDLVTALTSALPDHAGDLGQYDQVQDFDDPLNDAVNTPYGQGLQAAIALGGWEYRNHDSESEMLSETLTAALQIERGVGAQLRSVIAGHRSYLEVVAAEWLEENQDNLFSGKIGSLTFKQTLKYSRPTKTFFDRCGSLLLHESRRGNDDAIRWLMIGYLRNEPGYSFDLIVSNLKSTETILAEACGVISQLCTGLPPDQHEILDRGIAFWELFLNKPKNGISSKPLAAFGSWATNPDIADDQWLRLTESTVMATSGVLKQSSEVARRCSDLQPSPQGIRILLLLLGHGNKWEQNHIDSIAVEGLQRAIKAGSDDESVEYLRERLIQRGRYDV